MAIAILKVNRSGHLAGRPEIVTRGFVFEGENRPFLQKTMDILGQEIKRGRATDPRKIKEVASIFLEKYFYKQTGRKPMILPVVIEV